MPLLGFTLHWLFEHREGERLTFAAYDQLGGLAGAIGRAAEAAFERRRGGGPAALPRLLRGLAETSPKTAGLTLRDMPLADAPGRTVTDAVRRAGGRTCPAHPRIRASAMLRLAHDAVLRGWVRAQDITTKERDFYRIREDVIAAEQRWRSQQRRNDLLLAPGLQLWEAQSLKTT